MNQLIKFNMLMSSNGQPKVEISYIGCTQIEKETKNIWGSKKKNYLQQFSIKLKLLSTIDKDVCDITQSKLKSLTEKESKLIIPQVQKVITFFKTCLYENKNFTVDINISKASEELYNKYRDTVANKDKTVEEFIRNAPHQILLQGITIKLKASIKDINQSSLHQLKADLEKKLKQAKNNEQSQVAPQAAQTLQETEQNTTNTQVMQVGGSFGFNVANRVNDKAPVVFAAIEDNIPKYRIFFPLSNFFNDLIRLFFSRTPKLSVQKQMAITYPIKPQEAKQDEVTGEKNPAPETNNAEGEKNNTDSKDTIEKPTLTQVEENQEEKRHITAEPTFTQKVKKSLGIINDDDIQAQEIIKRANGYAETEMVSNEIKANDKQKTLDEIFCETVITYYDPQFHNTEKRTLLANSVFQIIFLKNIPEPDKISEEEILNVLKKLGLKFNKDHLMTLICEKRNKLFEDARCTKTPGVHNSIVQKILAPYEFIKQYITIQKAQKKAKEAIKNNNDKTHDEIFIEVIKNYINQDQITFYRIRDTVFYSIFCKGKNPNEIEIFEEIFNILKILEVQFNPKYLKGRILVKKQQLYGLAFSPKSQPPVQPENTPHNPTNPLPKKKAKTPLINIRLKLSLENVLSSKETYFCLIVIGAFILTLCLWHLPLGKVPILQRLVPEEKRENIGLILNIGLPILIALCVLSLAHFLYSEYNGFSVESVKRINANKSLPGT